MNEWENEWERRRYLQALMEIARQMGIAFPSAAPQYPRPQSRRTYTATEPLQVLHVDYINPIGKGSK